MLNTFGSEPLQREHGSWSEAMEDVEGVHVTDYDGSYVDFDDSELDDYV